MRSLDGGFVTYSEIHNANGNFQTNTEAFFTCTEEGIGLDGPSSLICICAPSNDGWDNNPPTCQRKFL